MVRPDEALDGTLGAGLVVSHESLDRYFARVRQRSGDKTETALGEAGWYRLDAEPYPEPVTDLDAPQPVRRQIVNTVRRVWIARFNPASEPWYDEQTCTSGSDVDDDSLFPWHHPEDAAATGNFWLSTTSTPECRAAIERLQIGDLVVVQRSDPKERKHLRGRFGATDVLYGLAIAYAAEEWTDSATERRERQVSLLPAGKFRHPVPRTTARRHQRLRGISFSSPPQTPDGSRRLGFTLSAVLDDDVNELLSVCGLHPDALAEPDLARLCARLRATARGNRLLWRMRWDHVYQHKVRTCHEQKAVAACKKWAARHDYVFRCSAEYTANAGYDLLFVDRDGTELQVEVKGYRSRTLRTVHLQQSQAKRATAASHGFPPEWKLYALLKVDTATPEERVHSAPEVVALLDSGGIQVR